MAQSKGVRVRWLDEEQEFAWRSVASMLHKLRWALECELERDADLSFTEYCTLARLSEEPSNRLRMSDLAFLTHASLSRLSHLITQLESRGYVRREPDPDDGRFTIAILKRAGRAKLVASAPKHAAAVRQLVFDELSASEVAQFGDMCERIVARVDASVWKQELS